MSSGTSAAQSILIVDDNEANLFALEQVLRETGAKIVRATSGNEALKATLSYEFALAILDVKMGGMDGYELAEFLRQDEGTANIPIIFLSGAYSDENHMFRGYEAGAVDFITKPFDPKALLSRVNTFLRLDQLRTEERTSLSRFPAENPNPVMRVSKEGRITYANASALRHLGTCGCRVGQFLPDHLRVLAQQALTSGSAVQKDMECGGAILSIAFAPVVSSGYVNLYGYDITDRKRAERALQESEERFRDVAFSMADWIWEIDTEAVYTFCSESVLQILGYEKEAVLGHSAFEFMAPEEVERVREFFLDVVRKREPIIDLERWNVAKDGRRVCLLTNGVPLLDSDGKLRGYRGVSKNITKRKQIEEELAKYREHLEQLVQKRTEALEKAQQELLHKERLATLGQLTGTVSHELRNPLGTIRNAIFSIRKRISGRDAAVDTALDRAERNICRCDRIIDELLIYARNRPPRPEATHVDEWLGELLDELDLPEGVRLTKAFSCGTEVSFDREKLRQCLVNVIQNACQAMSEKEGAGEKELTVETRLADGCFEIVVRDTGIGIKPEAVEKVFEPLYSTKTFGVGLGMSIVKQIIEQHGGSVNIESSPGEGTSVTLGLPVGEREHANVEPALAGGR